MINLSLSCVDIERCTLWWPSLCDWVAYNCSMVLAGSYFLVPHVYR